MSSDLIICSPGPGSLVGGGGGGGGAPSPHLPPYNLRSGVIFSEERESIATREWNSGKVRLFSQLTKA